MGIAWGGWPPGDRILGSKGLFDAQLGIGRVKDGGHRSQLPRCRNKIEGSQPVRVAGGRETLLCTLATCFDSSHGVPLRRALFCAPGKAWTHNGLRRTKGLVDLHRHRGLVDTNTGAPKVNDVITVKLTGSWGFRTFGDLIAAPSLGIDVYKVVLVVRFRWFDMCKYWCFNGQTCGSGCSIRKSFRDGPWIGKSPKAVALPVWGRLSWDSVMQPIINRIWLRRQYNSAS